MSASSARFIVSPTAAVRFGAARIWLAGQPSAASVKVIGETLAGPRELLLRGARAAGAAMGWRRTTLRLLARDIALSRLASDGMAVGDSVARDAIVARALAGLDQRQLGRLAAVSDTPGFVRAMGRALDALRMAGVTPSELASVDADLAAFSEAVGAEWRTAGLADRAGVFEAALSALRDPGSRGGLVDDGFMILDARIWTELGGSSRPSSGGAASCLRSSPGGMT